MPPLIFDAHAHAFPDHIAGPAIKTLVAEARWVQVKAHHEGNIAGLLASMDRAGITRAIMCSVATRPSQVAKITDWSAAIASDRIVPFASIHPDFQHVEAEVERIASLGIKGLKFHPQYMNCAVDDPRALRIARAAARANLAMTFHAGHDLAFDKTDSGSPRRIRHLHESVPDLRLLACHMGGWEQWEEVIEFVAGQPIYIETSFSLGSCPPELAEKIFEKHPREYLLFGTDSPWADQVEELVKFRALPISEEAKAAALCENAMRFCALP